MIDQSGYRPNVGIILCNEQNQVFWARRRAQNGWQFPQGGIHENEDPEVAMFRELYEEIGVKPDKVSILGQTQDWLYYELPPELRRHQKKSNTFKGQKQRWFLLRYLGTENEVKLDCSPRPEFDCWRWVDYWYPAENVVLFKQDVYHQALSQLEPML